MSLGYSVFSYLNWPVFARLPRSAHEERILITAFRLILQFEVMGNNSHYMRKISSLPTVCGLKGRPSEKLLFSVTSEVDNHIGSDCLPQFCMLSNQTDGVKLEYFLLIAIFYSS
jgi:hypothetical protein